jgi:hypothetical protein
MSWAQLDHGYDLGYRVYSLRGGHCGVPYSDHVRCWGQRGWWRSFPTSTVVAMIMAAMVISTRFISSMHLTLIVSQMSLFPPMLDWPNKGVETLIVDCYWHPHWWRHKMSSYGGSEIMLGVVAPQNSWSSTPWSVTSHYMLGYLFGEDIGLWCDQRSSGSSIFARS